MCIFVAMGSVYKDDEKDIGVFNREPESRRLMITLILLYIPSTCFRKGKLISKAKAKKV